ncbi:MAG: hypothetical protein ACOYT4_02645 [Nanoarchaeota archaeon]
MSEDLHSVFRKYGFGLSQSNNSVGIILPTEELIKQLPMVAYLTPDVITNNLLVQSNKQGYDHKFKTSDQKRFLV